MNRIKCILAAALLIGASVLDLRAQEQYASSPADLIQGRWSGVRVSSLDGNPDGLQNVNIRGLNTLRGDSQPLWIVDGVILSGELTRNLDAFWLFGESGYTAPVGSIPFLNPEEIESIQILKDVSATALYGALGANGVIIITTRRAKDNDPVLYVRSNVGVNLPSQAGEAFKTGIVHNHAFGISSLADNTAYRVSGYYRHNGGVVDNSGSDRFTLTASLETKANPVVWFGLNTIASIGNISSPGTTAYFEKPSTLLLSRYPDHFDGDSISGWKEDFDDDSRDVRTVSSAFLTLNFTKTLRLHTTAGVDFQDNRRAIWYGNGTAFGFESDGAASDISTSLLSCNVKSELSWKQFFAQDHYVNLAAAGELVTNNNVFNTMTGTGFFNHDLRAKGIQAAASHPYPHRFQHNYFHFATYVHGEYAYKDIFGVDATGRADHTPKYRDLLPVVFPSANAWLSLGSLIGLPDVFSTVRISGGWGVSGREYVIPYELTSSWLRGDYPEVETAAESQYESVSTLVSREWNIGAEIGLLSDRIKLAGKYYNKSTADAFNMYCFAIKGERLWNPAPRSEVLERTAGIDNRGLEFDLDARIIDADEHKLSLFATAAFNVNQISSVSKQDLRGLNFGGGNFVNVNVVGHQSGELLGYQTNSDGSLKDITADGKITEVDKVLLGNAYPELIGSFGASWCFKGLTVRAMMDGASGFSLVNMNHMLEDGVTDVSDKYVESADYLRLAHIGVDYALPVERLGLGIFKELRVCASARNLLTFTGYSGWNPDVNSFGLSVLSGGIDYGSFPTVRTVVLGISAKF